MSKQQASIAFWLREQATRAAIKGDARRCVRATVKADSVVRGVPCAS